jgi:hypothetical protein
MLEWEWYTDSNVMRLFIHCLLKANRKDKKWHGIEIKAGSFITSYENLSFELDLSVHQIRTALDKLKTTGEVANKTTSRYSMITINNWDSYQDNGKQNDKQVANEWQTNGKQVATTRECIDCKNEENNIVDILETKRFKKPTLKEIEDYCIERKNNVDARYFFDYYESCNWMRGKTRMKDWKATIRTWERNTVRNKSSKPETKEIDGWNL